MPNKVLPPSGPGRPKDLVKRKAILEAAKSLFLSRGYDGSSMDVIAAEAGVSKLTVYSHFTDKETLFAEAVKSKCEEQLP
ncbi:MAG: TetR/AcrR family transcriptional regulator, partial [Pseudomonadaceae bacterium]|nr:TetR/AcrR family transcriptional regulator [Pseudomonadaceae bacterium]